MAMAARSSRTTPRGETGPKETATDRRRKQILEQSALLFDSYGYNATSMNDIADAIGVRKPTLYHYFDTKDEILYWIHEEFINTLIDKQEQRIADGVAADDMVFEMMADILTLMETHRGHVRTYFEHHRELPEKRRKSSLAKRRKYRDMLQTCIAQGVQDGSFRNIDPTLASLAIFGMVNWSYQWYQVGGPRQPREVATAFYDMILNGLAPRP